MCTMPGSEPPPKKYKAMESIGLSSDEINKLLSEGEEYFQDIPNKCVSRTDKSTVDFEGHYRLLKPSSMPPIVPSSSHTVLIKLPVIPGEVPEPYVSSNKDSWDNLHVRMPFSSRSLYPVDTILMESLHFQDIIVLSLYCQNGQSQQKLCPAFKSILRVVLKMRASGTILKPRWELVKEALSKKITTSRELENAVLSYNTRYKQRWDFSGLHAFFEDELDPSESESFFENILPSMIRLALSLPDLIQCPIPLLQRRRPASISLSQKQSHKWKPKVRIGFEKLKFVGGGVLGSGCVQEEIQFLICPELIVSRLFTEVLDKTEALVVMGCERFSVYKGYSENFEWAGDFSSSKSSHESQLARDNYGRRLTSIVAIDALNFSSPNYQYSQGALLRELNKAYVGFHSPEQISDLPAIATGNWGCGVFKGDAHLKALLQLMASAKSKRDLMYFTFGNDKLKEEIYEMHKFLRTNKVPIGKLLTSLFSTMDICV
ncbi:hypothetical protein J437_LFUL003658 [Ladona fulva]|uniref:poly(ADP-ribose) glycohydrolase n=1 Tax=Ladona fulva TaxID=123851 RepID=A0A8K0K500_LADFU|nr:hypothetical protein J437_LFUL003658 [Ladona fulva]